MCLHLTASGVKRWVVSKEQTPPHTCNFLMHAVTTNHKMQECGVCSPTICTLLHIQHIQRCAYIQRGSIVPLLFLFHLMSVQHFGTFTAEPLMYTYRHIERSTEDKSGLPQHIIGGVSSCRWTSRGFIMPQLVSRWLIVLLAVLLWTPQLAFLFLSTTILRTAQGCSDGVDCKAPCI